MEASLTQVSTFVTSHGGSLPPNLNDLNPVDQFVAVLTALVRVTSASAHDVGVMSHEFFKAAKALPATVPLLMLERFRVEFASWVTQVVTINDFANDTIFNNDQWKITALACLHTLRNISTVIPVEELDVSAVAAAGRNLTAYVLAWCQKQKLNTRYNETTRTAIAASETEMANLLGQFQEEADAAVGRVEGAALANRVRTAAYVGGGILVASLLGYAIYRAVK